MAPTLRTAQSMKRCVLFLVAVGCGAPLPEANAPTAFPPGAEPAGWFREVTHQSGVSLPAAGAAAGANPSLGVSTGDVDDDGLVDFLLVGAGRRPRLFRNLGELTFDDQTALAGLEDAPGSSGCALADVVGDGALDVILVGTGHLTVYRGLGDGRFGARMDVAGSDVLGRSHGVQLADFDLDGRTDILTVGWRRPDDTTDTHANRIFLNRGDRFESVPAPGDGFTWTAASFDADGDGVADLFLGNDTFVVDDGVRPKAPASELLLPDALYRNAGAMAFDDLGSALGVTDTRSTMGAAVSDLDGDGRLDLYVSDFGENDVLLQDDDHMYAEHRDLGLGSTRRIDPRCPPDAEDELCLLVSWAAAAEDFDLDGTTDLIVMNGQLAAAGFLAQPPAAFRGAGGGAFEPVDLGLEWMNGRALLPADLDGDGDLDLISTGWDVPVRIFENVVQAGRWLRVSLRSRRHNPEGLGAVVTVELDDGRTLVRPVGAGGVVYSWAAPTVHFGLGEASISTLKVRWPDGTEESFGGVQPNQHLVLR